MSGQAVEPDDRSATDPDSGTDSISGTDLNSAAEEFSTLRGTLIGAAYRVLGSMSDAEDVVQEAWLRWADVDRAEVREPRAFLLTVTTRLALNRLRQQQNRRESYIGPWLPEPVATTRDGADAVELADSVSMAMLVVLETLSPLERATFVLREVFDLPYAEIASTLDKSDAAVRQLAHRARSHVQARQPRQLVDKARHREITDKFMVAIGTGNVAAAVELLAPDVVMISDGGGVKQAALRPIVGADKVARWLDGVRKRGPVDAVWGFADINGERAFVAYDGGELDTVGFLTIEEVGITALHLIRNPAKLAALGDVNLLG